MVCIPLSLRMISGLLCSSLVEQTFTKLISDLPLEFAYEKMLHEEMSYDDVFTELIMARIESNKVRIRMFVGFFSSEIRNSNKNEKSVRSK